MSSLHEHRLPGRGRRRTPYRARPVTIAWDPSISLPSGRPAAEDAAVAAPVRGPSPHVRWLALGQALRATAPRATADLAAMALSMGTASLILGTLRPGAGSGVGSYFVALMLALPVVFALSELYPGSGVSPVRELRNTSLALTTLFLPAVAVTLAAPASRPLVPFLAVAYGIAILATPLFRAAARGWVARHPRLARPVLVVGDARTVAAHADHLRSHPELGFRPVEVPLDLIPVDGELDGPEFLKPWFDTLLARATSQGICAAAVVCSGRPGELIDPLLRRLLRDFPTVLAVPAGWGAELPTDSIRGREVGGRVSLEVRSGLLEPVPQTFKRMADVVLTLAAGVVLLPAIAVISALVKLDSRGPVVYGQERIGQGRTRFKVWKFRTMIENADAVLETTLAADPVLREEWARDHKLRNDPRITRVGKFLRLSSLDELPQIWNVLRGEMSLVGPRPIVAAEIPRYGDAFELYCRVPPGLTGLWQVSGRNLTTYQERVRLDGHYVRNWSAWLDLHILFRTIKVVLLREGAF